MTAVELLERLRDAGVQLWADGERLHYDAPAEALDDDLIERLRVAKPEILALVRAEPSLRRLPLSAAQQGFWLLDAAYPGHPGGNEQFAIRLEGPLDEAALQSAWATVIERHAVLRARFGASDGVAWQEIGLVAGAAISRPVALTAQQLLVHAAQAINTPFDLGLAPLWRAELLRLAEENHLLLVTMHHIVADGASVPVIRDDLARAYAAACSGEPTAESSVPQYAELVQDERAALSPAALAPALGYWRERLGGAPLRQELPQHARALPGTGHARRLPFTIDAMLAQRLRALARAEGVTLFTLLLAALRVLLSRYSRQDDVLISSPVTSRDDARRRRMVGCLINTVVLRTSTAGEPTFREQLARERATLLGALEHRHAPFGSVVEALGLARRPGEQPLSQILFQFDSASPSHTAAGLVFGIEPVHVDRSSYWDLEWSLTDHGEGSPLAGHLCYAVALFEDWLMEALPQRWITLLGAVADAPQRRIGELPLLSAGEIEIITQRWNDTTCAYPATATLHGLVAARCRAAPQAVALRTEQGAVSYAELEVRVATLAAHLRALGAGPGTFVALSLPPSARLVIGLLAILRAGAAFVPLDPSYPRERRAFMLRDSGARLLLTGHGVNDLDDTTGVVRLDLDELEPSLRPAVCAEIADEPDSAAYVLYTSGSTGEPKGAIGLHRGAVNRCHWMWQAHGFRADDAFCLRTSVNFVDSLWEIFGALIHGIPLVVLPGEAARDPALLVPALARERVTQLVLIPPLLRALLEWLPGTGAGLPALRTIITSGEPLPPDLWRQAREQLPDARLINTYGTSEIWDATAFDTAALTGTPARVPIGRPIGNVRCYVLDGALRPLPPGVPGELCVAGVGVGAGYWQRPALTAERFVPDPFSALPGARLYRSGDLVRYLPDGTIECLGRVDRQLKLRGHRLEPGEIEAVLRGCPGVVDATVVLREEAGDARLVAYVALGDDDSASAAAQSSALLSRLRAACVERLPAFMQPAAWVVLARLPLTPSGKVDRDALPPPAAARATGGGRAVSAGMETQVMRLWADVLGLDQVAADADFFAIGGHSLLAMRLLARVAARFGVTLTLKDLFEAPTVAQMAALLTQHVDGPLRQSCTLLPVARDRALPLSWGQERLWFLDQLDPASPAYNIAWTIELRGRLDRPRLERALNALVARHEVLRSTFPTVDGRPVLRIAAQLALPLATASVSPVELSAHREVLARLPFDLSAGPLLRATLLEIEDQRAELLLVLHHIVTDGTSNGILYNELAQLYRAAALPPLTVQYADFAAWQRRAVSDERQMAQLEAWLARLRGAPQALQLPTDFPRPAEQRFRGAWLWRSLDAQGTETLRGIARERQCTLYMLLLTAFDALLARYSGAEDILVGTPVSARPDAALEQVVGLFVNTLVMRVDCAGDPDFATLLARVRASVLDAFTRQELPFERLVESLQPERTLSRAPVFQVMFNLVPVPARVQVCDGLELRLGRLLDHGVSTFDLTLTVGEHVDGLELIFEYDTDLFRAGTISAMADAFGVLLDSLPAVLSVPLSALPLVAPADVAAQRALLTGAGVDADAASVTSLFARCVDSAPGAAALVAGDLRMRYAELDARARRIATALRARGVGPGDRVGLCLARSAELVAAVLGTLQAGAAFVPLDPDYPVERLAHLVRDADPVLVIVGDASDARLPVDSPPWLDIAALAVADAATGLPLPVRAEDIAYVIYTSGSTGAPKGVVVTHGNLVATWRGWQSAYALAPTDRHLQMAGVAFDVFVGDLVRALLSGGCLVLCPRDTLLDPAALHGLLLRERISVAEFVPAVIRPLLAWLRETGQALSGLRLVAVGSDTWHASEYRALRALCSPRTRVVNSYGVAEATIDSAWFEGEAAEEGHLPIGRPFPQASLRILDARLQPVPVGLPGEICIGGAGVARGYWRRPELTTTKFITDPQDARLRLYRTGDRGRLCADGLVELLGRLDDQIKLRGQRIEPGEIEAQLGALPQVQDCVVGLGEQAGEARLVAWLVLAPGAAPDPAAWRTALKRRLPDYMVPAAFVVLPSLPLTPNGKLDRRALPAPPPTPMTADFVAPRSPLEEALCALFGEVLARNAPVGIHEDFFALGGHSLLATRLVARVRDVLERELPLRAIFESPTVAGLAQSLLPAGGGPAPYRRPVARAVLSAPQQRLWFLQQLEPASAAYNLHTAWRLRGSIDDVALEDALRLLVERHEALRTTFSDTGEGPAQHISTGLAIALSRADWRGLGIDAQHRQLAALVQEPFDLARGPLLRVTLAQVRADEHLLILVMHHIVSDGWSIAVLLREFAAVYNALRRGEAPALPPLPIQYADYARWQEECLAGGEAEAQMAYWQGQLAGAPALIRLPLDRPRPPVPSGRGAWHVVRLPPELTPMISTLARCERATPYMVLLAGFATLLSRYGGDEDVVIGTPMAGRNRTELEGLIGFFVNTLVLRVDLGGNPAFAGLLARVRRTALGAYAHAELPFEKLVQRLQPARSRAWTPLTQVFFAYHNEPRGELQLDSLVTLPEVISSESVKFDLSLHVAEHDGALVASFAYNTDLFDAVTVEAMSRSYVELLHAVTRDAGQRVGEVQLLDAEQREQVRREAARVRPGAARLPAALQEADTLFAAFSAQVRRNPQQAAIIGGGIAAEAAPTPPDTLSRGVEAASAATLSADGLSRGVGAASAAMLTYGELHAQALAIAARIEAAVGPGSAPVALLLGHDAVMVSGILGVLAAARPYVPLDPYSPAARNRRILEDCGAVAILTDTTRQAAAPWLADSGLPVILAIESGAAERPAHGGSRPKRVSGSDGESPRASGPLQRLQSGQATPSSPAYLLYTSGTTGQPKGVIQTHGNVLGQIGSWIGELGIHETDRVALLSGYGFDAAVQDIFGALLSGATLCPLDLRGGQSAPELVDRIAAAGLTLLHFTPTVYRYLFGGRVTCEQDLSQVRLVVLGGEAARRSDLELFKVRFRRGARLVNGLGLTESTMGLQYWADHDTRVLGETLPIGLPVPGMAVRLVDEAGASVAWRGELLLHGEYLSPGYHQDESLTGERYGQIAAEAVGLVDGPVPVIIAAEAAPTPRDSVSGGVGAASAAIPPEDSPSRGAGTASAAIFSAGSASAALPRRYLRTRDRARRLPDGQLLHEGRADAQLKIRGLRIEPGEIEAALRDGQGVRDAAVDLSARTIEGDPILAAWVTGAVADVAELRVDLRRRLPESMIPAEIYMLHELPRLPNGKVDRRALHAMTTGSAAAVVETETLAPTAVRVAAIWSELLGGRQPRAADDFFALGGHSLLATRLIARVRDAFGLEVPLAAVFEHTTLAALAAYIDARAAGTAPAQPAIPRLRRGPRGSTS